MARGLLPKASDGHPGCWRTAPPSLIALDGSRSGHNLDAIRWVCMMVINHQPLPNAKLVCATQAHFCGDPKPPTSTKYSWCAPPQAPLLRSPGPSAVTASTDWTLLLLCFAQNLVYRHSRSTSIGQRIPVVRTRSRPLPRAPQITLSRLGPHVVFPGPAHPDIWPAFSRLRLPFPPHPAIAPTLKIPARLPQLVARFFLLLVAFIGQIHQTLRLLFLVSDPISPSLRSGESHS